MASVPLLLSLVLPILSSMPHIPSIPSHVPPKFTSLTLNMPHKPSFIHTLVLRAQSNLHSPALSTHTHSPCELLHLLGLLLLSLLVTLAHASISYHLLSLTHNLDSFKIKCAGIPSCGSTLPPFIPLYSCTALPSPSDSPCHHSLPICPSFPIIHPCPQPVPYVSH